MLSNSVTGANGYSNRGYNDQNNYHASRAGPSRPDSVVDNYQNQAQESQYPYNQNSRRRNYPRVSTEQVGHNGNYPQHAYQRSYDNVAVMSGSGYTDPYGQSTDPSSLNSSMDQLQQQALQQQRLDERAQAEHGFQGFGAGANYAAKGQSSAPPAEYRSGSPQQAPAVDRSTKTANTASPVNGDKRKSWFKRRFSKD